MFRFRKERNSVWFRKILVWVKITIFLRKNTFVTYLTSLHYFGNLKQLTIDFWFHSEHDSGLLKEHLVLCACINPDDLQPAPHTELFIITILHVSFFKAIIVNHNLEISGFVGLYYIKSSSRFTLSMSKRNLEQWFLEDVSSSCEKIWQHAFTNLTWSTTRYVWRWEGQLGLISCSEIRNKYRSLIIFSCTWVIICLRCMIVLSCLPGCVLWMQGRRRREKKRERDREAVVISSQHPASLPQMTPRGLVLAASYNYHSAGVKDSVWYLPR